MSSLRPAKVGLRTKIFQIIFESDTRTAKTFDILLILTILASVLVVVLDTVESFHARFGELFYILEWVFTALFTVELALRLYCLERPYRYLTSFYGIVDLISVLPTWLILLFPSGQAILVVRMLRVLRIFRVLRLMQFVGEGRLLIDALKRSFHQIVLFLFGIFTLVIIFASVMYLLEPAEAGFSSIPISIYWASSP